MNEMKFASGTFTGAAAAVDIDLGFIPDYFRWWMNEAVADTNIANGEWGRGMAAATAHITQGIDAGGAVVTPDFVAANGITVLNTTIQVPDIWQASTVYAVGDVVRPATNNGCFYVCTTAGTSAAAEANSLSSSTVGATCVDATDTLVWTVHLQVDFPVERTKVQGVTVGTSCMTNGKAYRYVAIRGN